MKNALKTTGLILFLIGFGLFLYSFFMGPFVLDKSILEDNIQDSQKIDAFIENSEPYLERPVSNTFTFVANISSSIDAVNSTAKARYSITENDIQRIRQKIDIQEYSLESLNLIFNNSNTDRFKLEAFQTYGSWMFGRPYEDESSFINDLNNVADNINKFEVIQKHGFDKYQRKNLLYSLARDSNNSAVSSNSSLFLLLCYGLCIIGAALYILPRKDEMPGIKNNGIFQKAMTNTGWLGIFTGAFLILFYISLYYFPEYMSNWIIMVDPVSEFIKGSPAGRFFLYGFIYTLCILVMGFRMILKYRHSKYQIIRSFSVMFFQTAFAFLIPEILIRLNQPYFDFKNIWPLDYDFFFDNELSTLIESGALGMFMLFWGIALVLIAVPVFVYFFGKRWYCSWVCGCGGLAETLGDPYRQLSDKSLNAWKIERWMIHSVLAFAIIMTGAVLYTYFTGNSELLGVNSYAIRETYGAWIGAGFAGVIGTGFYPLMGNRVWCRFGCPLAAYLGIVQKFKSRFRITTNGGQCISCGNCSTYCEMGIDVRWYAQRGQNIIRSSCVGCGICSAVCPRGVLNLEVKSEEGRYNEPILIGHEKIKIHS